MSFLWSIIIIIIIIIIIYWAQFDTSCLLKQRTSVLSCLFVCALFSVLLCSAVCISVSRRNTYSVIIERQSRPAGRLSSVSDIVVKCYVPLCTGIYLVPGIGIYIWCLVPVYIWCLVPVYLVPRYRYIYLVPGTGIYISGAWHRYIWYPRTGIYIWYPGTGIYIWCLVPVYIYIWCLVQVYLVPRYRYIYLVPGTGISGNPVPVYISGAWYRYIWDPGTGIYIWSLVPVYISGAWYRYIYLVPVYIYGPWYRYIYLVPGTGISGTPVPVYISGAWYRYIWYPGTGIYIWCLVPVYLVPRYRYIYLVPGTGISGTPVRYDSKEGHKNFKRTDFVSALSIRVEVSKNTASVGRQCSLLSG